VRSLRLNRGTNPRITYRPELDGLRAISVGLVIVSHASLPFVNNGGDVGVTAFFVLSGYLITGLLLDERDRTGRIDLRAFYGRRVRRLAPALVLLLSFVVLVGIATQWPAGWSVSIASTLLYVSNWVQVAGVPINFIGHTWSLSIEEQFYLLWPAFLILAGTRRAAIVAGVLIGAATIIRTVTDGPFEYFSTITRGDAILVGCLLAIANIGLPAWCGAVGVVAMVVVAYGNVSHDLTIPIAIVAAGAVIAGGWRPLGVLAPMGRRAYGLYLWNWPLAVVFEPLAVPLTFVAAELSWRLVEVRFIRRRTRAPSPERLLGPEIVPLPR
jgi:peptidoglycan/LPS O-acetylase OafA/YrhL